MAKSQFWIAGILFAVTALAAVQTTTATKPADAAFTVTGKLATGVMAIGAETTGITITSAANATYELDIKDAALKKKAEGLNGTDVTVTGTLTIKAGVEVAQRKIITVTALEPAKPAATATATAPK